MPESHAKTAMTYRVRRRIAQVLSTAVIVVLPFFNIMRLDVPTVRFYFFNTVLWVDEFYLLFLAVMLILWVVVIFSMLYGRVWCGWMCPQTVLDEMHHWCTARANRFLRISRSSSSALRRVAAFSLVAFASMVVSLFIGFNLVAYFVDPYRMIGEIAHGSLSVVITGIIVGIAALVFIDVTFWREKFCAKACPYGMLQVVFTDAKTQIVRYQTERDGECIECNACVRDCMMGIDIRLSPYQTECIHCGDCVDSCTTILSRLKQPIPTLIGFAWGEQEIPKVTWYQKLGFVDAKRWGIVVLTLLYAMVLVTVIHLRQPLSLSASGDRSTLYHLTDDGRIYNEYGLRISNRDVHDGWFTLSCVQQGGAADDYRIEIEHNPVFLKSREVRSLKMSIYSGGKQLNPGPNRLELKAVSKEDTGIHAQTEIVFFMPEPALRIIGTNQRKSTL